VFAAFAGKSNVRWFIETKMPKEGSPGAPSDSTLYAAKLDQLVRRYGLEDRVVLHSFDWRTLRAMRQLNPCIRTCPLAVPRHSHDYATTLRELGAGCIVLSTRETTPAQVAALQREGVLVFSGVIDSPAEWEQALEYGYDALFSNDPVGLMEYLK